MKKSKKWINLALAMAMILCLGISAFAEETSPLDTLEFTLPSNVALRRDSDSRETFVMESGFAGGSVEVGGVFLLDCDEEILNNVVDQQPLVSEVLSAMKGDNASDWDWSSGSSSLYGLLEISMGNNQGEYKAYVVRGYSACYIFWFNMDQLSTDEEIGVMKSLRSDDITDELNRISSQEFSEAMAQLDFRFEFTLPSNMEKRNQTEDGALFYRDGQLAGGYQTTHIEKDILLNIHENQELILEDLKEYLAAQIDLTDFTGEIIDETLIRIVARFTSGDKSYVHYILSNQSGTQYDVWFDESQVDETTIAQILSSTNWVQE